MTHPLLLVVVLSALAAPAVAFAQTLRPDRPYRGVYGGGVAGAEQVLSVNGSIGGGLYLRSATGLNPTSLEPYPRTNTEVGQGSGSLSYSLSRGRASLGSSFSHNVTYFPTLRNPYVTSTGASFSGALKVTKRTSFAVNATAGYQPLYFFSSLPFAFDGAGSFGLGSFGAGAFGQWSSPSSGPASFGVGSFGLGSFAPGSGGLGTGGELSAIDQSTGAELDRYVTTSAGATLGHQVARRVGVSLSYSTRRSSSPSGSRDLSSQSASGGLSIEILKGVGLRLGYGQSDNWFGEGDARHRVRGEQINAGLNLNRDISLSRRMRLSFSSGVSGVSGVPGGSDSATARNHYYLTGNVGLTREVGRSWSAAGLYNRAVTYNETFQAPTIGDSVTGSIGGLITRALQFQSSVGYSTGTIGFSAANGFTAALATTGVSVGLSRNLGVSLNYAYARYRFDNGALRPLGLPQQTDQQSVNVSFTAWQPLFTRRGGQNATR